MLTRIAQVAALVGCVFAVVFFLGAAHTIDPTLSDIADGLTALAAGVGVFIASFLIRD